MPGRTLQAPTGRTTFHKGRSAVSITAMRRLVLPLLVLATFLVAGCVERRIYVRSDPPGADVYIDGEHIGRTRADDDDRGPLYANFIFYGTREYTIRKPGYATVSGDVYLEAPWYQYPPIDFFAEVLTPWIIVDEHEVSVELEEAEPANVEELYRRALNYRYRSRPQDRYEYAILKTREGLRPRQE